MLDILINDTAREIVRQKLPHIFDMVTGENEEFQTMPLDAPFFRRTGETTLEDIEEADLFLRAIEASR
jgi:diphthamide synthase (EF-2-diphthine--ammonia ligase)